MHTIFLLSYNFYVDIHTTPECEVNLYPYGIHHCSTWYGIWNIGIFRTFEYLQYCFCGRVAYVVYNMHAFVSGNNRTVSTTQLDTVCIPRIGGCSTYTYTDRHVWQTWQAEDSCLTRQQCWSLSSTATARVYNMNELSFLPTCDKVD